MTKIDIKKIFSGRVEFMRGAPTYAHAAENHYPEIALIGASNCGKSSLINSLFNQKAAIVSSLPGRTRQLNFFKISGFRDGFVMVDMPGYGFAKASLAEVSLWQKACQDYFINRSNLKRVFLLIDGVKKVKISDYEMMQNLEIIGLSFQIIITKIDKLSIVEQEKAKKEIENQGSQFKNFCSPGLLVSSKMSYGIYEIQNAIISALSQL